MLTQVLTWHQVMPEIIEFLLEFRISERPTVFHHSGFRSEMNLSQDSNRLALRTLGRSGRKIRLCHILRTAERVNVTGGSSNRWPWILRPTVTYHSFDIESQRSMWLVFKLIEEQTLMSTPILHYPEGHGIINRDALLLFLAMSLPLLVITFVVWIALYWHKKRSEKRERLVQSSQAAV